MQTADELHHLVHSLSPREKRAFTMHARRHVKNPQYLRLFTTLDRLTVYDAAVVRRAFKGTLAEHNLNELRYALLEELVACVDRLQPSDDVVTRLQREAEAVEFLAARGCYATAERRLRRARASARSYELPSILLDLCAVQRRTMQLTTALRRTLAEDEAWALGVVKQQYDAARLLDVWTQRSSTMERFSVRGIDDDPCLEPLPAGSSVVGELRQLHASILRSACLRDAGAFVVHVQTLAHLLKVHSVQLSAYAPDVNSALIDVADEAALLGISVQIEALQLPPAHPHAHVPRHRVAMLMRSAMQAFSEGDVEKATRLASLVLNDGVLCQAHEAWTAKATLLAAQLHMLAGHRALVTHLVRSALRTEERRSRFTAEECEVLKRLRKPQPSVNESGSESRSARSANKNVPRVRRY